MRLRVRVKRAFSTYEKAGSVQSRFRLLHVIGRVTLRGSHEALLRGWETLGTDCPDRYKQCACADSVSKLAINCALERWRGA